MFVFFIWNNLTRIVVSKDLIRGGKVNVGFAKSKSA